MTRRWPWRAPKTLILIRQSEQVENQYHCKDYQILIPMIIYGSKSELERPRYHKNWDNAPIDAPLTFGSHNFWSNRWIFKFHTFLETGSQDLFRGVKINPIKDRLKVAALEGPSPWKSCWGYKRPQSPFKQKKGGVSLGSALYLNVFYIFSLSSKHKKNIKTSWFFSLYQKHKVLFLYPTFFSLVLHLGFGV